LVGSGKGIAARARALLRLNDWWDWAGGRWENGVDRVKFGCDHDICGADTENGEEKD
jgi:hypothetical protein